MYHRRLVAGLAVAFAAMSVALATAGLVANYLVLVPAALFAGVAYVMWFHASGRLAERIYRSVEAAATGGERARADGRGRTRRASRRGEGGGGFGAGPRADWEAPGGDRRRARGAAGRRDAGARTRPSASERARRRRRAAFEVLGVDPGADEEAVREAYRERVKEVHPDNGGSQAAFRRVRAAYERLAD